MTALTELFDRIGDLPDFSGVALTSARQTGTFGNTPLHIAAIWGDVNAGKLLIEAGGDINAQGENGYTPLHEAVEQRNYDFVRFLLEYGADWRIRTTSGFDAVELGDERIKSIVVDFQSLESTRRQ